MAFLPFSSTSPSKAESFFLVRATLFCEGILRFIETYACGGAVWAFQIGFFVSLSRRFQALVFRGVATLISPPPFPSF